MSELVKSATVNTIQQGSSRLRLRKALREKLLDYDFTHFITLASNHQVLTEGRMRSLLKEWDARVNRDLIGPKWTKRPDERLLWLAFPEKMDVNPHWHMVAQIDPAIDTATRAARTTRLSQTAEKLWLGLLPQGSFDCQGVESPDVIRYITKMSARERSFDSFIFHREFMNI